jgi:DNA helicase-4
LFSNGFHRDEILVLYRRTAHIKVYKEKFSQHAMSVQFKTVHGAKGLEAKVVFIVGLTEKNFPNVWQSDRIFQVVKEENIDLLFEEERRLFYVALTRAKESVYLISEKGNESTFIDEIGEENLIRFNYFTLPDSNEFGSK